MPLILRMKRKLYSRALTKEQLFWTVKAKLYRPSSLNLTLHKPPTQTSKNKALKTQMDQINRRDNPNIAATGEITSKSQPTLR